jgi:hypothetical protein
VRRAWIASPALLLGVLLAGCPPEGPKTPGAGDPAPVASASGRGPASGSTTTGPKPDPLAGSLFSRDEVLAIYTAEVHGGAEKDAALLEHRLVDAHGAEVPTRARAYERAIQTLAEKDPDGWAAFVESLQEKAPR